MINGNDGMRGAVSGREARGLTAVCIEPGVERTQGRVRDTVLAFHERTVVAADDGVGLFARLRCGGHTIRVECKV